MDRQQLPGCKRHCRFGRPFLGMPLPFHYLSTAFPCPCTAASAAASLAATAFPLCFHRQLPLPCVSTAFVAKTLLLPCDSTDFPAAKTLPLPCVSAALVAKPLPLPCLSIAVVAKPQPFPRVCSTALVAQATAASFFLLSTAFVAETPPVCAGYKAVPSSPPGSGRRRVLAYSCNPYRESLL